MSSYPPCNYNAVGSIIILLKIIAIKSMGAQRENRESENIFTRIFNSMRNLACCVWYPLPENAIEGIDHLIEELKLLKEKMIAENPKK